MMMISNHPPALSLHLWVGSQLHSCQNISFLSQHITRPVADHAANGMFPLCGTGSTSVDSTWAFHLSIMCNLVRGVVF